MWFCRGKGGKYFTAPLPTPPPPPPPPPSQQSPPIPLFVFLLERAVFIGSEITIVMKQHCTFNNCHLDRVILLAVHKWLRSVISGQCVLRAVWIHNNPYGAGKI